MSGVPRDYPGVNQFPQIIRSTAAGAGAAHRKGAGAHVSGAFTPEPQQLEREHGRMRAQIAEAISILESGSDYERMHVVSILRDGLRR